MSEASSHHNDVNDFIYNEQKMRESEIQIQILEEKVDKLETFMQNNKSDDI